MPNCAVIIPIYRDILSEVEKFSMDNNINKLKNHDIYLIMPKTLELVNLCEYNQLKIERFEDAYFKGYHGYNHLMMSEEFYQRFEKYEKILICQYDVWVFEDRLEYFCNLNYDYIGAPAFLEFNEEGKYRVLPGNGGFSLRDVENILKLLKTHAKERDKWAEAEDKFFSVCAAKYSEEFSMSPLAICVDFAFDRFVSTMYEWNQGQIPFAIHSWYMRNPWFVCRFMMNDIVNLPDIVKNDKSKEELMKSFYDFLSRNSTVILYGAGEWAKIIARALQILNVNIRSFAISNGQNKTEQDIFGIPVFYWSEISTIQKRTGVIISIAQRYCSAKEIEELHKNIHANNIDDILDIDFQLFSFIEEIVLKRGEQWR